MEKYFVYYNLHKHLFSCKNKKTGLVNKDLYSTSLKLSNCQFKVSEAGRQRVLKEKRKNVHAGIVGNILDESILNIWQNNESLATLRKQQLHGQYDLHSICSECTSWENYPNIWSKWYKFIGLPVLRKVLI